MKNLEINQMESIEAGSTTTAFICGAGFAGYLAILETGFWAAGIATGGVGIIVGLGVSLVGAAVCSQA